MTFMDVPDVDLKSEHDADSSEEEEIEKEDFDGEEEDDEEEKADEEEEAEEEAEAEEEEDAESMEECEKVGEFNAKKTADGYCLASLSFQSDHLDEVPPQLPKETPSDIQVLVRFGDNFFLFRGNT